MKFVTNNNDEKHVARSFFLGGGGTGGLTVGEEGGGETLRPRSSVVGRCRSGSGVWLPLAAAAAT